MILAGNFLGKNMCIYTYMCLKAPKEWWNLVLQNAKDSKDIYNFAHSASHIMQAKNSTKCSLSHFNWNWATNCTPWNWQIARENEWLEDEISFWSFGSFGLAYFQGLLAKWGYFSFRAGTWQEKRAKVRNPQRSINISRMPELTYYTRLHYVLRVETWTPHLPSRCAQHPSNISGKSEGEVMPAAISPAWKQRKETTQGLSPSILSIFTRPPALAEKFHHP